LFVKIEENMVYNRIIMQNLQPTVRVRLFAQMGGQVREGFTHGDISIPRSIERIARYHSLSVSHFSALFRLGLGTNPRDYVQRLRMKRTRELLRQSDMTQKEIAAQCGYVDAAHFSRHFKRETGQTPGQFRASEKERLSSHVHSRKNVSHPQTS
jgi:AraC-like DNA-binding protein